MRGEIRRNNKTWIEKKCTKCGEFKSLLSFWTQPRGQLGRRAECSICSVKAERLRRKMKMVDNTTIDGLLQFFEYKHLPEHLQESSKPFCELAHKIAETYPQNPERTVALRKLLEAKDAGVRSLLYK